MKNPGLAVNSNRLLGLVYQRFTGTTWDTKLELTSNGWASAVTPLVLHTAPSSTPPQAGLPYIGDYIRLLAVGADFYGVFCGNNTPNMANFPNGVTYQRSADWTNHRLLSTDGITVVPPSIDPFFFRWSETIVPRGPIARGPIVPAPRQPPEPIVRDPGPSNQRGPRPIWTCERRCARGDAKRLGARTVDQHSLRGARAPRDVSGAPQGAHCRRLDLPCDTRYLTFDFADRVGLGDYLWLYSDEVPYTAFAGDWVFATALYGARPYADAAYIDEVLRRTWQLNRAALARLRRVRAQVEPFLDHCMGTVRWTDYTLVGFTSVFQQNLASLALAARIKRAHPDLTIAFGGANWEEAMGVALQEQFPFVDLAFSGEADESFPAVLAARREGRGVEGIPGVTASARNGLAELASAEPIRDMNSVPVPDYEDFFEQLRASRAAGVVSPTLLVETARGCWWGERAHCTFCGLNGATMAFRSKTPGRVLEEITTLRERHGVRTFNVVDDILDMSYLRSVLPRQADAKLGIDFFW